MDMKGGMWSGLPWEILEHVLAFVPVPDLCRYRAVCKAWDSLITDPRFAARHNAASTSCIVMSCRPGTNLVRKKGVSDLWCILDVHAKRWYMVGYDDERYRVNQDSHIMPMDGGLVCQYLETQPERNAMIVRNPIAKLSARVMPVAPDHVKSMSNPMLRLVVGAAEFKVILINHKFHPEALNLPLEVRSLIQRDPLVRVYKSTTNEWRSMRNPPWINTPVGSILQSIMFRGWLYVLFRVEEYVLRRYDAEANVWETLAAPISIDFKYPKLVVSDQRLFLAAWHSRAFHLALDRSLSREWKSFYTLFEIKVPGMARETVFDHSRAKMVALLQNGAEDCESEYPRISVFGFGSCLLFMSSSSGNLMTFDVAKRTWDRNWPQNPLRVKLPDEHHSWVGEHMNLLLPSMRW